MYFIDSHCHLDFAVFDADRGEVVQRATANKVRKIVVPSVTQNNWSDVIAVKRQYQDLVEFALGLHPMFMSEHKTAHIAGLRAAVEKFRPVAIGECGLDFYIEEANPERQISYFVKQLELANEFELPVIIHARKSVDIVLKHIRRMNNLKGVMHSFSGSRQQAEICIAQGFMLGFGGPITYDRAKKLHRLIKMLPLEHILLETDAPDQPDCRHRGQRNEPGNILSIAKFMAELKGLDLGEIAAQTSKNAEVLFKLNT